MKWYNTLGILLLLFGALSLNACSDNVDASEAAGGTHVNPSGYENPALKHPGCMFGQGDLDYLNTVAEQEASSYNAFIQLNSAKMGYSMEGPFEEVGCENQNHSVEYANDMTAVLHQAVRWYMTGQEQYAKNAMDILRAWATTHKTWDGPTVRLVAGESVMDMAAGAEILRSCYSGWESDLNEILKDYFTNVIWETIGGNVERKTLEKLSSANQGAVSLRGALAIAVFLDDKEMFNNIIDVALYHPSAGLTNVTLENGQFADFGRDMGHAGGMMMDWARISEIAWHQGVDLFGVMDNRLMKCIEYFCEYNMTETDWSDRYRLFGAGYSWYRCPSSDEYGKNGEAGIAADRADHDNNFLTSFCLYRGAYENRKGLPELIYTKLYEEDVIRLGHMVENVFLYTRGNHGETAVIPTLKQLSFDETDNPTLQTDGNANQTELDIKDGVYTLSGSGYNSGSPCLAYMGMEGDGALVVRLDKKPEAENGVIGFAGLMIRESLDESSIHDWVYIGDNNGGNGITKYYSNAKRDGSDINVGRGFTPGEPQNYPVWLKLEKHNGFIYSYDSYDGVTWLPVDLGYRYVGTLSGKYYLGLVVTSNSSRKEKTTATFSNVKLLKYNN